MENFEEIYDQAAFFAEVYSQLPEEFKEQRPLKECLTSVGCIIWDASESDNTDESKEQEEQE